MKLEGQIINGFELKHLLGKGGMAEVWYAENEIGKPSAVKILNEDLSHNAQIVERFRNEAVVMVKLDHPNIRQVYGYGIIDERPCIVMEYLEGDDLKERLKRGQRFTEQELESWWNQLADALNYTHNRGIVHRDIKPGNIFVDNNGKIKLLDFGIAKVRESISTTQTGQKIGTLMYMSPEQVKDSKHVDYRTDIYSLAVTFVHLITGKRPYDSDSSSDFEISEQIVYKPLDLSGLSDAWRTFLSPYLEKDKASRPPLRFFESQTSWGSVDRGPSVDEVTVADGAYPVSRHGSSTGESRSSYQVSGRQKSVHEPKSKKGLWIALGAIAVVAIIIILVPLLRDDHSGGMGDHNSGTGQVSGQAGVVSHEPALGDEVTVRVNGISIVMKPVQGGTFQMGSNDYDAENDEYPVHNVTVNSFYMCETEVTQALWEEVMGTTIYQQRDKANPTGPMRGVGYDYPMYYVNWNECQDFIRRLNQRTGRHFRLPTEAEWEYAARGGNQRSGYKFAGSSNLSSVGWYVDNSNSSCHPVRRKAPNELGLYDMSGNVWEWCSDGYNASYYYNSPSNNPQGGSGQSYVVRGGSWYSQPSFCRVTKRHSFMSRETCYGFRLVMDL